MYTCITSVSRPVTKTDDLGCSLKPVQCHRHWRGPWAAHPHGLPPRCDEMSAAASERPEAGVNVGHH